MKKIDFHFFPGWVRKSITFTIDDGNIPMDTKFKSIIEPAGFKGTFNLHTPLEYEEYHMTVKDYQEFYQGYEIANHCKYHAFPITPKTKREIQPTPFDRATANQEFGYLSTEENVYRIFTHDWVYQATDEKYIDLVKQAQVELESVFGKGKIRSYVWPYGFQQNEHVFEMLKACGFQSIRKTGSVSNSTNYSFPEDRTNWSYNIKNVGIVEEGEKYDAYPDDGELKFFCFGLHSIEYERAGEGPDGWKGLEIFAKKFGNRPNDFWYASNGELFDYQDAVKALKITDKEIRNDSDVDLYGLIDGKRSVLAKHSVLAL